MSTRTAITALAAIGALAVAIPAAAQDFYKGKTINILAGFSPGGGYDANARVLARHMGRHIPGNPAMIVQNMPGAGSLNAVHYLNNTAAKDGTVLNTFNFGAIGEARLNPGKVKIDFRKFNWIGSISQDLTVCYVWHTLGVKTLAELVKKPKVHYGSTGAGSSSDLNQKIMKNIFGVKLQQVGGYPGSAEQRMAIQRGELDGDCGAWSSIPADWIRDKKINPVIKSSPATAADMPPGVPFSIDIAPDERSRQIMRLLLASNQLGRPFIASAAVPAERVKILRDAFAATVKDPKFIAEATKLRLPVSPTVGEAALKVVEQIYRIPDDIVAAARKVIKE
ncbi:MAG: Bug family tripartite tricarboxylate transporter substrate binding protein [Xanthobacteraceae bacterium]